MEEFLLGYERDIYTAAFFAAITFVALWEGIAPRRRNGEILRRRWGGNFALAAINAGLIHLIFPVVAVGFSIIIESHSVGILRWLDTPLWVAAVIGYLAIDLGRYLHHYLLHSIPLLWRLHRIHHADLDYDFTVGLRFHPMEGIFTVLFTFAVIALVGPPPIAVIVAEILVVVSGTIVHANGRTPQWVERHARRLFVTPDMHRIHHSTRMEEHNSNYSAVLSIWDRIFGTYVADCAEDQETMQIGLPDLRDPECLTLYWMLTVPFRNETPPPSSAISRANAESSPDTT